MKPYTPYMQQSPFPADGKLLWETTLPFSGNATPATYMVDGRQFVVIAAGRCPFTTGDLLVVAEVIDRLCSLPGRDVSVREITP